ncbi:hypothetical protein H6P81_008050 [Aristolochia fimbriata]|uniref:Uncharacterized protein n=1 Tax=Aristolochia fimbriata TaxID=158543 RepID=A0AAV7F5N0_ARIFI|nr:hypothetical protein H6P81_008050 [Aristolochia fimbriata]
MESKWGNEVERRRKKEMEKMGKWRKWRKWGNGESEGTLKRAEKKGVLTITFGRRSKETLARQSHGKLGVNAEGREEVGVLVTTKTVEISSSHHIATPFRRRRRRGSPNRRKAFGKLSCVHVAYGHGFTTARGAEKDKHRQDQCCCYTCGTRLGHGHFFCLANVWGGEERTPMAPLGEEILGKGTTSGLRLGAAFRDSQISQNTREFVCCIRPLANDRFTMRHRFICDVVL